MEKIWIGIDNGVSGTIGILGTNIIPEFFKTPVVKVQDYCKAKKNITRLDAVEFHNKLKALKGLSEIMNIDLKICLERPMVNPSLFKASESALRCFEAMWAMIELLNLPVQFIPSTDWQKELLPKGTKGEELKRMSLELGNRWYPQFKEVKHPDRDGLLIAHWMKLKNL